MSIPMRGVAAALLATIVLSLAACGGGSPSATVAPPAATAPAASPAPAPAHVTPAETKPVPIESGPGSSAITSEVKQPKGGVDSITLHNLRVASEKPQDCKALLQAGIDAGPNGHCKCTDNADGGTTLLCGASPPSETTIGGGKPGH